MTVCGKLYLWILIKISIAKEILETKLKSTPTRIKLIPGWHWDAKRLRTNSLNAKSMRWMAGRGSAGEVPFLRLCQKPDYTVKTIMVLSGLTQHPCQFCSVSFLAGWKKVGRFWTKNSLLHSHLRPLTETFKLKRENGSHSRTKNLSFTTPGDPFEWQ